MEHHSTEKEGNPVIPDNIDEPCKYYVRSIKKLC